MLQTFTLQLFLSSWEMLFQQQATVDLQAKHTYKNHTASPENPLYWLLNNTWFGYW